MNKKIKLKKWKFYLLLVLVVIFISGLFLAPFTINKQDGILYYTKQLVPEKVKIFIKKTFLKKNLLQKDIKEIEKAYEKLIVDDYIINVSKITKLKKSSKILSKNNIEYSLKEIYLPFKSQKGMVVNRADI